MTARIEESDRILGFELGADDYIQSPLAPRSWSSVSRRCCASLQWGNDRPADGMLYVQGHAMRFDERNHTLHVNDEEVFLTAAGGESSPT